MSCLLYDLRPWGVMLLWNGGGTAKWHYMGWCLTGKGACQGNIPERLSLHPLWKQISVEMASVEPVPLAGGRMDAKTQPDVPRTTKCASFQRVRFSELLS